MLFLLLLLTTSILLLIHYFQSSFNYWSKRNIPTVYPSIPWGNCGNFLLRNQHIGESIHKCYNLMKPNRYFGFYISTHPALVISDPKLLRLILTKDFQTFPNRNLYSNIRDDPISAHLLSLNGEKWKKLRSKLTPIFTSGKIKAMFEIFKECTVFLEQILEKHIETGKPLNAKNLFTTYSCEVIANCVFGLDLETLPISRNKFKDQADKTLELSTIRALTLGLGSSFPKLFQFLGCRQIDKKISDFFMDIVKTTVDERLCKNKIRNDFLQLLIGIHGRFSGDDDDKFTLEELTAQCFIFFLAGYETSASTMSFLLYEICLNPMIYQRITKEIDDIVRKFNGDVNYEAINEMTYLHQVVQETLRKHSPAYYVTRTSIQKYNLGDTGVCIEKGTQIIVPIRALHYDSNYFENPEKFDPDRFSKENKTKIEPYSYLPFGEGPRNCIGLRFGLLEVKLALISVLRKYQFSINGKTDYPLKLNPKTLLVDVQKGIWLNCQRI